MASLAELRDRLRRRPGMGGLTDEEADALLTEASETVLDYCGWQVWPREVTALVIDTVGGRMVSLPTLMLHEVQAVETRPLADLEPDAWESADGGWDWSESGWLYRRGCWPDGPRRVRVQMDSGYEDPPGAIGNVLINLAVRIATAPVGVSSEAAGGENVSYQTGGDSTDSGEGGMLTDAARRVLDRYRITNRP